MKRFATAIAVGSIVAALVAGSAASLGGINSALGADSAVVASCDSDGVTATYSLLVSAGGFVVDRVTVGGIDPSCVGRRLDVVLTRGGGSIGSGFGTVTAATTTVSISGTPRASDVDGIHLAIN